MLTSLIISAMLIAGVFALGVGCCCCYCTSCTQTDDEAATFDVTVTGVINGSCCANCSNVDGTYNVTFNSNGTCSRGGSVTNSGCCYYDRVGDGVATIIDCSGCGTAFPNTYIDIDLSITSDAAATGAAQCAKTLTSVDITSEIVAGQGVAETDLAHFEDLADPILDCTLASYNARDIPYIGAIGGSGCDWVTTPATCTVTRT